MAVTTRTEGNKLYIKCPYSKDFIARIKRLGGRWNAPEWVVDLRQEDSAREVLCACYGDDGTARMHDMVNVQLTGTAWNDSGERNRLTFYGRTVASRRGRDDAVSFGPGVVVVDADFAEWAGSVKYPDIGLLTDTPIFEVFDVPRSVYEQLKDVPGVKLIDLPKPSRKEALQMERDRLAARLAEIDKELEQMAEQED